MANSEQVATNPPETNCEDAPASNQAQEEDGAKRVGEAARRAVERIKNGNRLTKEEWVARLSSDLAKFED